MMLRSGVSIIFARLASLNGVSGPGGNIRFMSSAFDKAQAQLQSLKEDPGPDVKLKIYALFKQATKGDVTGSRPSMVDFVGRAKYDAWVTLKGISQDEAKTKYAELVATLAKEQGVGEATASPASTVDGLKPIDGLDISIQGKAFVIRLNRPTKFNALTLAMYEGLVEALNASEKNPNTSITVITGTGNYFCSGNDLTNFAKAATAKSKDEVREMAEAAGKTLQRYVQAWVDHGKPILALVNGPAVGIAVTVLPLCDLVLATDKSSFVSPFSALGQSPEACSSYTFPLLLGQLRAAEFLLFGKKLSAHDALQLGLVNEVIPDADFADTVQARVKQYSELPPESLGINKRLLRDIHREALTRTNETEVKTIIERWQSAECARAIANFMAKSAKK